MGTDGKLERAIAVVPPEDCDAVNTADTGEPEKPNGRGSPLLGAIRLSELKAFRF